MSMADDVKVVQHDQQSLTALFRSLIHSSADTGPSPTEPAGLQLSLFSLQAPSSTQINELRPASLREEATTSSAKSEASHTAEADAPGVSTAVEVSSKTEPAAAPNAVSKTDNSVTQKEIITSEGVAKDEHRWRKYGQKNVKGADFPRSYYKCSVKDCPAKKYCEQFIDKDSVTKFRTVYVDSHVHQIQEVERVSVQTAADFAGLVSSNFESLRLSARAAGPPQLAVHVKEQNPPDTSVGPEEGLGDPAPSSSQKTRKGGARAQKQSRQSQADRLIVQLDRLIDPNLDGFQWRKYGRKSIKGSDVPRQYFRCSFADCPVKKQVEPHSDGSHTVTYESFHSHDIPTLIAPKRSPDLDAPEKMAYLPSSDSLYAFPLIPKLETSGGAVPKRGRSSLGSPDLPSSPAKRAKLDPPPQQLGDDNASINTVVPHSTHSPPVQQQDDREASIAPSRGILAALMHSLQNPDLIEVVQQFSEYASSWRGAAPTKQQRS